MSRHVDPTGRGLQEQAARQATRLAVEALKVLPPDAWPTHLRALLERLDESAGRSVESAAVLEDLAAGIGRRLETGRW